MTEMGESTVIDDHRPQKGNSLMNENQPIEKFLETASAGLAGDRELQLDVQAELRSHLDERLRDAKEAGLKSADAESKALAMMGEPLELADKLATANRHRMRLRAWIRHTLRWTLVPLAVLVAILCAWQPVKNNLWVYHLAPSNDGARGVYDAVGTVFRSLPWDQQFPVPVMATPDQRLFLECLDDYSCGRYQIEVDQARIEQVKRLLGKPPANKTHVHAYLSIVLHSLHPRSTTWDCQFSKKYLMEMAQSVTELQASDSDNARIDYLLALIDLKSAGYIRLIKTETGSYHYRLEIVDRAKFDQVMGHLQTALHKPAFSCHYDDAYLENLEIRGRPTSIADWARQVYLQIELNDLQNEYSMLSKLQCAAVAYGEILAREGRKEEAGVYFDAWQQMVRHLVNSDTCQSRVILNSGGAVARLLAEESALAYERLGDQIQAEKTRNKAKTLRLSTETINKIRNQLNFQATTPAVARELAKIPSSYRTHEHLLMGSLMIEAISLLLLVAMLGCLAGVLRFRFRQDNPPLLLLPGMAEIAKVAGFGVLLPFLAGQALFYWLLNTEHFNLSNAWPQFLGMQIVLMLISGWLMTAMAIHFLQRRCRQLGVPVPSFACFRGWWWAVGILLGVQLACFFIPDLVIPENQSLRLWTLLPAAILATIVVFKGLCALPPIPGRSWLWPVSVGIIGAINVIAYQAYVWDVPNANLGIYITSMLLELVGLAWIFSAWRHHHDQDYRLFANYRGTLVRSMIPILATAMLLLNLVGAVVYRLEEQALMNAQDELLFLPGSQNAIIMKHEVDIFRAEIQSALDKLEK
jgi:hypothetical protein